MCADVENVESANGTPLIIWPCHDGANQKFTLQANGEIRGLGDKCVDAYGARGKNGDRIVIWQCNGQENQKWSLTPAGELRGIRGKVHRHLWCTSGEWNAIDSLALPRGCEPAMGRLLARRVAR